MDLSRRAFLLSPAAAAAEVRPIDSHIHLFDPKRFPYHPAAPYQPSADTVERYVPFAANTLSNAVIVQAEPYQDDHRYLEFCFQNEPRNGFFKGTCLFDPLDPQTPARMEALTKKWPGRIVALRIHSINRDTLAKGAIHDRPLSDPRMIDTWRAAHKLGLAIQMHMIPAWAGDVGRLIFDVPGVVVIMDHLCRPAQGSLVEYEAALRLGAVPGVYMKFSGLIYSSSQPPPHADLQPVARRIFKSFGPEKIIWGGLGMNAAAYGKQLQAFETIWSFISPAERDRIRYGNAQKLYKFS